MGQVAGMQRAVEVADKVDGNVSSPQDSLNMTVLCSHVRNDAHPEFCSSNFVQTYEEHDHFLQTD